MSRTSEHGSIKPQADFIEILEALYAPEEESKSWLTGVTVAFDRLLVGAALVGLNVIVYGDNFSNPALLFSTLSTMSDFETTQWGANMLSSVSNAGFREYFLPNQPLVTLRDLHARASHRLDAEMHAFLRFFGCADAWGMFVHPEPGVVASMFWLTSTLASSLPPREQVVFHRIIGHLDTAIRLRTRPDLAVAAVLAPDGTWLDLAESDLEHPRDLYASKVVSIERSRLRARRRDPSALGDWRALVEGHYTLSPREDRDGKRYYLLLNNPPALHSSARFTPRERDVLRLTARGFSGKEVSYNLGISPSVVSEALARAAEKMGLRSRVEVVRVASALRGVETEAPRDHSLTPAELQVLDLLGRGLSNAEIARLRESSANTVANQVASLLKKTDSPSRRALVGRFPASSRAQGDPHA